MKKKPGRARARFHCKHSKCQKVYQKRPRIWYTSRPAPGPRSARLFLTVNSSRAKFIPKGCYVWMHIPTLRVFWTANNGSYYDINNEPLLGTHILRMGAQEVRKISPYFAHLIAYPRNNNVRIQQWNHCWCHNSLSNGAPPSNRLFTCRAPLRQNIERLKFSPGRARHCKRTKLGYRVPQLRPRSARACTVNGV